MARRISVAAACLIAGVLVASASIALALLVTPMQPVSVAGQTVRVGAAAPTLSTSGPGELDLFGQRLPTTIRFAGPVRPRLALSSITLNQQLGSLLTAPHHGDPGQAIGRAAPLNGINPTSLVIRRSMVVSGPWNHRTFRKIQNIFRTGHGSRPALPVVRVYYLDGRGILREVLQLATARGFSIAELSTARADNGRSPAGEPGAPAGESPMVEVILQVHGRGLVNELAAGLSEIPGVRAVVAGDVQATGE
jgi:hypothetical protein